MTSYNYDGQLFPETEACILPDNRGLRFGDGLFETIKFKHATLILADRHFARLWHGLRLMLFQIPESFNEDALHIQILELLERNKHQTARIRVTVIRGEGALDDTENKSFHYIIQTYALEEDAGFVDNGLRLCFYEDVKKPVGLFSNLKHNNFLPYSMGALYCRRNNFDDAIILNTEGRVCDTTRANIFMVYNNKIMTPALSEGCVAGVIRETLIRSLSGTAYEVQQLLITVAMLQKADEIFLTNSIHGMRKVSELQGRNLSNIVSAKIHEFLERTNSSVFC